MPFDDDAGPTPAVPAWLTRLTHLGRGFDLKYPSNLFVLALAGAAAVLGFLLGGDAVAALHWGGAVLFTWALGREIERSTPTARGPRASPPRWSRSSCASRPLRWARPCC
jgi:hypothetical protein